MNKTILVGRLTQNPEVRYTNTGKAVASFTLAVGRKEQVQFIPIVAWEKTGELCGNSLSKGSKVLVEGYLQIRSYEGNDGQKRRVAEVVAQSVEFLDSKKTDIAAGMGEDVTDTIPF